MIINGSGLCKTKINLSRSSKCRIDLIDCSLYNSEIEVSGENNTIYISQDCKINNCKILIKGNNCRVSFGKNISINGATFICMGIDNYISVGDDCMFASGIQIWNSDTHPIYGCDGKILNPSKPINIGNKVWIGNYVTILKGVEIGKNSIIGMNSTVTKNLPSNSICVGTPAKPVQSIGGWSKQHITI